jgi:hypothetical protein
VFERTLPSGRDPAGQCPPLDAKPPDRRRGALPLESPQESRGADESREPPATPPLGAACSGRPSTARATRVRWQRLCALGSELPEVSEGRWYGTPALQVRGRFFVRLKEDGESVVFRLESLDEQDFLTSARGELYFVTDHYRGYRAVLARLRLLSVTECRARLETAWRAVAPKTLVKRRDSERAAKRPPRRST